MSGAPHGNVSYEVLTLLFPSLAPMTTRTLLAIALLAAAATSTDAQSVVGGLQSASSLSCVESLPDSAFTRVPVFAAITMFDSVDRPVPPVAENMLQSVVDRLDTMLGAKSGTLPHGDPGIRWDSIGRGLRVTWHRDGQLGWRIEDDIDSVDPSPTKTARLFASALDSATAAGETFMPWPESYHGDSVQLMVYFRRPWIDDAGKVKPIDERVAVPMFTVATPREKTVILQRRPHSPHYPEELLHSGIEGKVTLQFVVDTTGRADSLTFRDLWPRGEPRLEGEQAAYYAQLVAAAKRTVKEARFLPAEVGGCKVRQVVQQPFTWLIR